MFIQYMYILIHVYTTKQVYFNFNDKTCLVYTTSTWSMHIVQAHMYLYSYYQKSHITYT